jgi:hypothetical protein
MIYFQNYFILLKTASQISHKVSRSERGIEDLPQATPTSSNYNFLHILFLSELSVFYVFGKLTGWALLILLGMIRYWAHSNV